jgi:hypothetical protein
MAQIILLLREESSQSQLENGVSGVGAIQTRELGYTEEKQEFSFKTAAGSLRHITSREKMLLAAAAATSGAKGVGYFPASGLSSVTVQDALDELRGQVAAGGGGTTLGTGTAGALTKWTNSTTLGNSILTESGSAIRFSGDTVANLYRSAAGALKTDGNMIAGGSLSALALAVNQIYSGLFLTVTTPSNGDAENIFAATFQRNTSGAIEHSLLKAEAVLNSGGSNSGETINIFQVNTVNTATTGMTVNLANLKYGGVSKFSVSSAGNVLILGTLGLTGNFAVNTNKFTVDAATGDTTVQGILYANVNSILQGVRNMGFYSPLGTVDSGIFLETHFTRDKDSTIGLHQKNKLLSNVDSTYNYGAYFTATEMGSGATVVYDYGIYLESVSRGSTANFAIFTNDGKIRFGDDVSVLTKFKYETYGCIDTAGNGTPEGVVTAEKGSTFRRADGGPGTCFYVKESGSGNTGWVAK